MFNRKSDNKIKTITPFNYGWVQKNLEEKEIEYLWRCIKNKKESHNSELIGNISETNKLIDKSDWFFTNSIKPLIQHYEKEFGTHEVDFIPTSCKHPYTLDKFWVNFQKKYDYFPVHRHTGIYSFVVWMKIPTNSKKENNTSFSGNYNSSFHFLYSDIFGHNKYHEYQMNSDLEGTILLFSSKLHHVVYPFYQSEDTRISISGNISLNTSRII